MLKVTVMAVGAVKEPYIRAACLEYQKRLQGSCRITVEEIAEERLPEQASDAQIRLALRKEGDRILKAAGNSTLIALCIEGDLLSSEQLAERLNLLAVGGHSHLCFVIGSSHGLSEMVKEAASFSLSMSRMTFPHTLVRVLLLEQVYRALQIQQGSPYHK